MKIRLATPDDLSAILALERELPVAAHWTEQQYRDLFRKNGPPRVALVIECESGLKGFLVARVVAAEWEIENVGVAGKAQRNGSGTALMRELLDLARRREATAVFLEVRESNLPARGLYSKLGFIEHGRRKAYYRDPDEDAVSYRMVLS